MKKIEMDVNCDMGESYGNYVIGNDDTIMPYITSCSIACGFHGGDPFHIEATIDKALSFGINIGAHPSYPDLAGFGRRYMSIPRVELRSLIKYQVACIKALVESKGGRLSHVKPHGALYNRMSMDRTEAITVLEAVAEMDNSLKIMLLANSEAENAAKDLKVPYIKEAFIDRRYNTPTSLTSRNDKDSVIIDPEVAVKQFFDLCQHHEVGGLMGERFKISPQSLCIHGDNPNAEVILRELHKQLHKQDLVVLKPYE